jgi:hypothetical protein
LSSPARSLLLPCHRVPAARKPSDEWLEDLPLRANERKSVMLAIFVTLMV